VSRILYGSQLSILLLTNILMVFHDGVEEMEDFFQISRYFVAYFQCIWDNN